MAQTDNIQARVEEIYDFLAADEIQQATKRMLDLVQDFDQNLSSLPKALEINQGFQKLEKNKTTLSFDENKAQRKALIEDLFALLDKIQENPG